MTLDPLQHAELASRLIKACGGVDAILEMNLVSVGRTQLFAYASKTDRATMSAEVMDTLEGYCGQRIYSGFIARQEAVEAIESLLHCASETDFLASDLQRSVIQALSPGSEGGKALSINEKTELTRKALSLSEKVLATVAAIPAANNQEIHAPS